MTTTAAVQKGGAWLFEETPEDSVFTSEQMTEEQRLIDKIVGSLASVPKEIQQRQVDHFTKADPEYRRRVAEGLGLPT